VNGADKTAQGECVMENRSVMKWTGAGILAAGLLVAVAVPGIAQSREFRFSVTGSGSATGSDQSEATDEAFEKAKESARTICTGRVDRFERTGSNCVTLGSDDNRQYSCLVFVRADCVTRVR
jgi:hypothetical protein